MPIFFVLSVFFCQYAVNFPDSVRHGQPFDDNMPMLNKDHKEVDGYDPLEDVETNVIGSILPDDEEELLAGITDDFDLSRLPSQLEDLDENDLFGSGGGLEMDFEPQESLKIGMSKMSITDGVASNGIGHYVLPNGVGPVAGEHPYGEHPSRTLFVRNINSNVEDSELKSLFEVFYIKTSGPLKFVYLLMWMIILLLPFWLHLFAHCSFFL